MFGDRYCTFHTPQLFQVIYFTREGHNSKDPAPIPKMLKRNTAHARLLHKLDYYGIRGNLKSWIGSFLSGRKQRVVLDGCKSSEADVAGIPCGTVLGPLLFLAFINDLPEWAKHSDTHLFADDSLLFCQIKDQKDAELRQQDLKALEDWVKTWQMSFHPSKCTVIRIPPQRKNLLQTSYWLHGHTLEIADSSKYLGITISEVLKLLGRETRL